MRKEGLVVKVLDPMHVVINLGSHDGVREDSRFLVFCYGDEIVDPDTGASLGRLEIVRGIGKIKHIQEQMTTIVSNTTRKEQRQKAIPDFESFIGSSSFNLDHPKFKTIVETVDVIAPFEGVQERDLVRMLTT